MDITDGQLALWIVEATGFCTLVGAVIRYNLMEHSRPAGAKLKTYAPITEREVLTRLLGAPGSPLYQAIEVVIDEEVVRLLNEATEEGIAEEKLRHRLGGAAALTALKETLAEKIEQATAAEATAAKGREKD